MKTIEERMASVRAMRDLPQTEKLRALATALEDRSNLIIAQAAKIAGEQYLRPLIPNLIAAFDRMADGGARKDPHCRAKLAIVHALAGMEYSESGIFLRALRHVQMEPVWGAHEDTAPVLRGAAALCLVHCRDIPRIMILRHIVDALCDPVESVRIDAIRALDQLNGDEAALILRFKARSGDPMSRVVGMALESLLRLEGEQALPFVAGYLESPDGEICEEAALALASSRLGSAVAILKDAWARERGTARGRMLLRMIAASGMPEGISFLLDLVVHGMANESESAVQALEPLRSAPDIHERLQAALKARRAR